MAESRPLLGVPVLRPSEPIGQLIESVGTEARLLIIDNSEGRIDWEDYDLPPDVWINQPYTNLGCGASWNAIIRQSINEPYWLIANADTVLAPGAIEYVVGELEKGGPRWVGIDGDWRLMGLTPEWVGKVGWYDERFSPIYHEDTDMEYRGTLAGAEWYNGHPTGSTHVSGASWKGTKLVNENNRTYRANTAEYARKWGGGCRGGEAFTTPFDSGRPDLCGPPISRLRAQAWNLGDNE